MSEKDYVKDSNFQDSVNNVAPKAGHMGLYKVSDPLGPECFRLPPFGLKFCTLAPYIGFVVFVMILIISLYSQQLAVFISSFVVWISIYYIWGLVPAGNIGFLRPGKGRVWHINMGFLAFTIYNRHLSRREFIDREFARILRTASSDDRIKKIAVKTWLFNPYNVPQYIPRPSLHKELKHLKRISAMLPVYFMYLIANHIFYRSGRKKVPQTKKNGIIWNGVKAI
ncbi:MAG: hypothetical protein K6T65_07930 [Peptococcaceae bacterium]|nr:hypothetical protein [Peptococcaceae bacterium]